MNKSILLLMILGLIPFHVFAVDGVVLINQSTVTAQGGFPYIISTPGSYKLSGPLTMSTTVAGNYRGNDVAIVINTNNVSLDLNGFSIVINNTDTNIGHGAFPIYTPAISPSQISIKNGFVNVIAVPQSNPNAIHAGILMISCLRCSVEDVAISVQTDNPFSYAVVLGKESLLRHNRLGSPANGSNGAECPSVIIENTGIPNQASDNAFGCVAANNVP
jgi:hypothetical protein